MLGVVADDRSGPYWVVLVLLLAAGLRLLFFPGFFGSDDLSYTYAAFNIAHGRWIVSPYVGAMRFGINLPVALSALLFGFNAFAAALWCFGCSIAEIAVVYWIGRRLWGRRAGLLAALLLALAPLHIHYAGRLMADPPWALFITLSLGCFLLAERTGKPWLYLASGLAAGAVLWIKEATVIFAGVFLLHALLVRTWRPAWWLVLLGGALMVAAHLAFFAVLTGNPFYVPAIMAKAVTSLYDDTSALRAAMPINAGALHYWWKLFIAIDQTWLLGPAALLAALALGWRWRRGERDAAAGFLLLWGLGLLLIFSFFPIRLSPLSFIMKQNNYMVIFLAPLALLAAWWLARLPRTWAALGVLAMALGALPLAALSQQSVRVFTGNSKAALAFAVAHPEAHVFGGRNAENYSEYRMLVASPAPQIFPLEMLADDRSPVRYVVVDQETQSWDLPGGRLRAVPDCWQAVAKLEPEGFGAGWFVARALQAAVGRFSRRLDGLVLPKPATVFEIPATCALPPGTIE